MIKKGIIAMGFLLYKCIFCPIFCPFKNPWEGTALGAPHGFMPKPPPNVNNSFSIIREGLKDQMVGCI